jgi:hypothetical protein
VLPTSCAVAAVLCERLVSRSMMNGMESLHGKCVRAFAKFHACYLIFFCFHCCSARERSQKCIPIRPSLCRLVSKCLLPLLIFLLWLFEVDKTGAYVRISAKLMLLKKPIVAYGMGTSREHVLDFRENMWHPEISKDQNQNSHT